MVNVFLSRSKYQYGYCYKEQEEDSEGNERIDLNANNGIYMMFNEP